MSIRSRTFAALPHVLALAVGLAAAPSAHAQDRRLVERLDPGIATAVLALVDSAHALELPTEPIVQKALEGQSKGASGAAIVAAVRALIHDLVTARTALGGDVSADVLLVAAAVLEAGGTPAQLERLRPHRSNKAFAGGLAGMAYLMSRGVKAEHSLDLITAMMKAGLPERAYTSLQQLVERDMMAGAPAAEAATVRVNALIRHGPSRGPGGGSRP